jgi:tetratricopeptide (TPR) repeat protein
MKHSWVKVMAIAVALALGGAGAAFAAKAPKAQQFNVRKALLQSYDLIETYHYKQANAILDNILKHDPGNPLALNNKAAIMVAWRKFDKADTLLKQALVKAKGHLVEVNRVCSVGNICLALKPVSGGMGTQGLEPLIRMNLDMVKAFMTSTPIPGKGLR